MQGHGNENVLGPRMGTGKWKMALHELKCPSCGGTGAERRGQGFVCTFCGSAVVPRLLPGTICGDAPDGIPCTLMAEALCRGCGRPLCDWHSAPKRFAWMEPYDPRCLKLNWNAGELTLWVRLNQPFHHLPLEGFEPFEWIRHPQMSEYAVGQLEQALAQRLRPLVASYGGELREAVCAFDNLCLTCDAEVQGKIRKVVEPKRKTYRRVAYQVRLDALLAEAKQVLAYVEAFLHYPISTALNAPGDDEPPVSLQLDSPAEAWERKGVQAKERIAALEHLKAKIGTA